MPTVDVEAAIRPHLDRANRRFDAAMDALVPPTTEERVLRDPSPAVSLGLILGQINRSLREAAQALAIGFAIGDRSNR